MSITHTTDDELLIPYADLVVHTNHLGMSGIGKPMLIRAAMPVGGMGGMEFIWPACFMTGVVPADRENLALCADALTAWSIVIGGGNDGRPATFGEVMATIALRLGVDGTPDSFMAWCRISFVLNFLHPAIRWVTPSALDSTQKYSHSVRYSYFLSSVLPTN